MNTFFISDTHFFHDNILKLDNRPWNTMCDMLDDMLERWNNKVSKNDTVYILGDYTWKQSDDCIEYLKKLAGKKRLLLGNHDFPNAGTKYKSLFESIKTYDEINIDGKKLILSHYYIPMYNSHYHGSIMLHGHTHNTAEHLAELEMQKILNNKGMTNQVYNVGCMLDYMDYTPRTLEEIINWKGKL